MNLNTDNITSYTDQELEEGYKALSDERRRRSKEKKELEDHNTVIT